MGDRGSGKTQALLSQFWSWMQAGVPAARIGIVVRNRYRQRDFWQRLWQTAEHPLTDIQIWRFSALVEQVVMPHYPLIWSEEPLRVGHIPSLVLLSQFLSQTPDALAGLLRTPRFYERLLNRLRLAAHNGWSWEEMHQRAQQLNEPPLAQEANHLLQRYRSWLNDQHPPLLDEAGRLEAFRHLLKHPPVMEYWQKRYSHWLVDDIDEATPLEQDFLQGLWSESTAEWKYSANPFGGLRRQLGAHPEYLIALQQFSQTQVLPEQTPPAIIRLYHHLRQEEADASPADGFWDIQRCREPGAVAERLRQQLEQWQQLGAQPQDVVMIGWAISAPLVLHLQTMAQQLDWPLDVFQSSRTVQSDPLVQTLLALLRLVLWHRIKENPAIPPLKGWDFYQIYRVCGQLEPMVATQLFHQWRDQPQEREQWGRYLREHAQDSAALARLYTTIPECRERYLTPELPDVFHLTHYLFTHLILPILPNFSTEHHQALHVFLAMVSQYAELQPIMAETETRFIAQMLSGDIAAALPQEPPLERPAMKLMTASKLCEIGLESPYQIWLDISADHWYYSEHHPLLNAHLLSRSRTATQPWNLEEDEQLMRHKLAALWRKGLQYCQKKAVMVVFEHDRLGRKQYNTEIVQALQA